MHASYIINIYNCDYCNGCVSGWAVWLYYGQSCVATYWEADLDRNFWRNRKFPSDRKSSLTYKCSIRAVGAWIAMGLDRTMGSYPLLFAIGFVWIASSSSILPSLYDCRPRPSAPIVCSGDQFTSKWIIAIASWLYGKRVPHGYGCWLHPREIELRLRLISTREGLCTLPVGLAYVALLADDAVHISVP